MKFYKLIFLSFMTFLNVPTDRAVKPEVWKSVIKRIQEISMEKIGIPCIYGVDQIHGASYTEVLRGFEKIELEPGESATVGITIPASDLAFVGMDGKWRLEEGDFIIKMGNLNTRIRCTEDFVWKTPNIEK